MPIFLTSGAYQIKPWKFFALDGFAALISVPVWIYLGFLFGDNLELLEKKIRHLQTGILAGVAAIVVAIVIAIRIKSRRNTRDYQRTSSSR